MRRAELDATDRPMRFAYADPPYPGLARRYYGQEEVDHRRLVDRLVGEYPDGWALSTSSEALRDVWALCPAGTRLGIWVKGPRKVRSRHPLHAFEALLVVGGRQHSHPDALPGMKPAAFLVWMFRLLGASRVDRLDDLFPGSGAVGRAWELYTSPGPGDDVAGAR